jgi:hypothetical protein
MCWVSRSCATLLGQIGSKARVRLVAEVNELCARGGERAGLKSKTFFCVEEEAKARGVRLLSLAHTHWRSQSGKNQQTKAVIVCSCRSVLVRVVASFSCKVASPSSLKPHLDT